jgi:hypothetical protein
MISAKRAMAMKLSFEPKLLFRNSKQRENLIQKMLDKTDHKIRVKARKGETNICIVYHLERNIFTSWEKVYDVMPDIINALNALGYKVLYLAGTNVFISWDIA